jgi:hypothetical protein
LRDRTVPRVRDDDADVLGVDVARRLRRETGAVGERAEADAESDGVFRLFNPFILAETFLALRQVLLERCDPLDRVQARTEQPRLPPATPT